MKANHNKRVLFTGSGVVFINSSNLPAVAQAGAKAGGDLKMKANHNWLLTLFKIKLAGGDLKMKANHNCFELHPHRRKAGGDLKMKANHNLIQETSSTTSVFINSSNPLAGAKAGGNPEFESESQLCLLFNFF